MAARIGFWCVLLPVAILHCSLLHAAERATNTATAATTNLSTEAESPGPVPADATANTNTPVMMTNVVISTTNIQSSSPDMPALTAEDFRTSWQIPPPGDDKWDWVQLKSGEWLKGEIKALQQDTLYFDSDELDEQEFDWKDVHKLISPTMNTVRIDDGQNRETVMGSLWITRDKIIVDGEDTVSYPRRDLFGIVPGTPTELNYWGGKVSLGLTLRSGNTESVDYNASVSLARRTTSTRLTLDYL